MAVFKCKMCGAPLEIHDNSTTASCDYCGSQQTLPRINDDKIRLWYDRANHFRRNNEFDKAMGLYEQILNENNQDAESYWSIILCKYGIEYVEDPISHKRIPTVNRAQYTSIFDDDNYQSALKYADISQKIIYEQEAATINEIQKGILDISQKEEPFDVFICYKETDENGQRTHDSVYANQLYHELTQEGFKVFFARITLEDKLGTAYEPYIFAALNSAKVMVVIGSKPEYFNAVWVRNEWSRYLTLIKSGAKKYLIPAYKDMDPYDLPKEFSHLQAQDMNQMSYMLDLVRNIKKLVGVQPKVAATASVTQPAPPQSADSRLYNVRLHSYGNNKLGCIKVVRETFGYGLKDAKDLVESPHPMLARNVSLYKAEQIKNRFLRNGFEVSLEETDQIAYARTSSPTNNRNTETLLKRVTLFLEGEDWENADTYCEKVLDVDPENGQAYVYKLLAHLQCSSEDDLQYESTPLEGIMPYKNALRFADEETANRLIEYNRVIKENIAKRERDYQERVRLEQERKQREAKRQQELNALQMAKKNATDLLSAQVGEKDRLQKLVAVKQAEAKTAKDDAKKIKRFAILTLLSAFLAVLTFIAFVISLSENEWDFGSKLVFFSFFVLLYLIFNAKLLKAQGKSQALVLANILYGIPGIVMAFSAFGTAKKLRETQYDKEIASTQAHIQKLESYIDNSRRSLNEINQKLETFKKQ